jgi:hypothetical protein
MLLNPALEETESRRELNHEHIGNPETLHY